MWNLLRVIKELAFSDPDKGEELLRLPDDDERRDDGRHRDGMTKEQFFTELEKLTEVE
jgi:hypothetical protein